MPATCIMCLVTRTGTKLQSFAIIQSLGSFEVYFYYLKLRRQDWIQIHSRKDHEVDTLAFIPT